MTMTTTKREPESMPVDAKRATLKPGERATGFVLGRFAVGIVGQVPYTGMNRQQRRAMARQKA